MRAVWLVACVACWFEHGAAPVTPPAAVAPAGSAVDAAICPADYTASFGGHFYKQLANVDWNTGQMMCAADQGHLAKIETMAENDYLHGQLTFGFAWIGLKDTMGNDTFYWTDGTPLGSFNDFAGTTASQTKDCVDMGATAGTWAVYTCTMLELAICECP
ncbi:MAG: C-type lectin domain-containing protein [Acidobacteriota bacterium]